MGRLGKTLKDYVFEMNADPVGPRPGVSRKKRESPQDLERLEAAERKRERRRARNRKHTQRRE